MFRNNSMRLKINENTQVHLRKPHIVREWVRTFRNLSKPHKTQKNILKWLKTSLERQTKLQNLQDLFRTNENGSDYPWTSVFYWTFMNHSESFRVYESTSEHLKTTQMSQRTPHNFQKPFIIHENRSEYFRKAYNIRECLRTFSNLLKLLTIRENASEHQRNAW